LLDLIIRNGEIIDGTRRERFRADIGIQDDRIAEIGHLPEASSQETIDAAGKIVAPGFIDVHNHSDGWLLKTANFAPKTLQGFTTEVLMADGISYAPVNELTAPQWMFYLRGLNGLRMDDYQGWHSWRDYMQRLDRVTAQNTAAHLPYANIRSLVCGFGNRHVDDFQMRQIRHEIRRGMEAGAVGLSTGLDYIVQCYATTDELVEACSVMSEYGGIYATHMRYKKGLLPALAEAVEIGRRAGVAVHISHLKVQDPVSHEELFAFLDRARRDVEITFDVYPYQPGSTMLAYFLPYEAWEDGPLACLSKLYEPRIRQRFREGLDALRLDLEAISIAWVAGKENARHQGKTLTQYIAETGKPAADALLELLIEERLAVLCVMQEGDDALIHPLLQHDLYMLGTDGIYFPEAVVHPRAYGSVGRLLGPCVRDAKLFSLEDAIHKLAQFPTERFGLVDRGAIKPGAFADVVVFDPSSVCDNATFADPARPTTGIDYVLVNGDAVIHSGELTTYETGPAPGRFLRFRN